MPSFISCGLAVIEVSVGASALHRDYCLDRLEAYRRPDRNVTALIDTGADSTVVDLDVLEGLCLNSHDLRKVEGFNGQWKEYPVYNVSFKVRTKAGDVIFEDSNFEVVGVPLNGEHYRAILGMDILHNFTLKFHREKNLVHLSSTVVE